MKLNFKQLGEGEPLIIVHGLFGSLDNWMTMARALANKFQVFLVDQRNHGKSPHHDQMTYSQMANDIKEFIQDQSLEKVNLIGHSMGGKAIIQFALNHSNLINKMVVIDIGIKKYPMHHQKILAGLHALNLDSLESRKQARERISEFIEIESVQMFLLKGLFRKPEGGYGLKFNFKVLEEQMPEILSEVRGASSDVNVLFVRGEHSGYILDEDFEEITEQFPLAKIETVNGAGHWIHAEKPSELQEILFHFF